MVRELDPGLELSSHGIYPIKGLTIMRVFLGGDKPLTGRIVQIKSTMSNSVASHRNGQLGVCVM